MSAANHQRRRIAGARKRFLRRIRKELRTQIPDDAVGFRPETWHVPVFTNGIILFAYRALDEKAVPRNWNAFGAGPPSLRGSNNISVEVNVALHRADRRVGGLFARDETGNTVLLHRGRIGGGAEGVGQEEFMRWYSMQYPETKVSFSDPSRDGEVEAAILVAELHSSEFVSQIESFVDSVRRFKDDPGEMSESDLREKAAAAPAKPKSSIAAVVVHVRSPHVAKLAKRRAGGKCELCGQPAPFKNSFNEPYLESHHIVWLAHGGADQPENTVALCPNCHRKMHVVNDAEDIRTLQRRAKSPLQG